jgi:trimethylamine:corrinoid methyltransferase-like protein
VDEVHLQADLIERVGIAGHYLTEPETLRFTRQEYVPVWPPAGQALGSLIHEEALEILHTHVPPSLPDGAADRIEEIVAEADQAFRKE